jgi:hypothetical protein
VFDNVTVSDGVFNVTPDFGSTIFGGAVERWLEVAVRPGAETGAFEIISPRTRVTAAPMALSLPGVTVNGGSKSNLMVIGNQYVGVYGTDSFGVLEVDNDDPSGEGISVTSDYDGIQVNGGRDGVFVVNSDEHSFSSGYAGKDGVYIQNAFNGLHVISARNDGLDVKAADAYGVRALGDDAGAYLRNAVEVTNVRVPDLILGGTNGAAAESDDGVIQSEPSLAGSDIILRANDAVAIFLDEDGSNDGDFEVHGGGSLRFNVDDDGGVSVPGTLSKGGGSFEIDHPLDPENRILRHSFVESPDMMNVYNGNVILDGGGEATIDLPEYFDELNSDFRYQLTCVGGYAPVYVADKIQNNRFRIAGGTPGLEVSWQVTGIRQDAWANENRIVVEEDKEADDQGRFLHPEAFGRPASQGMFTLERDTPSPPVEQAEPTIEVEDVRRRQADERQRPESGL